MMPTACGGIYRGNSRRYRSDWSAPRFESMLTQILEQVLNGLLAGAYDLLDRALACHSSFLWLGGLVSTWRMARSMRWARTSPSSSPSTSASASPRRIVQSRRRWLLLCIVAALSSDSCSGASIARIRPSACC